MSLGHLQLKSQLERYPQCQLNMCACDSVSSEPRHRHINSTTARYVGNKSTLPAVTRRSCLELVE